MLDRMYMSRCSKVECAEQGDLEIFLLSPKNDKVKLMLVLCTLSSQGVEIHVGHSLLPFSLIDYHMFRNEVEGGG